MKLYTTLKRIKEFEPCKDDMNSLYRVIGEEYPEDKEIYFSDLLNAGVDLNYILWGLRAVPEEQKEYTKRLSTAFACDCAERVLHIYEKQYPDDKRPRIAIEATRKWLRGEADDAAWDAAWDAALAAAEDAALAAAWVAAGGAAWAAVWAAVGDALAAAGAARGAARVAARGPALAAVEDAVEAASAAERAWQVERLIEYVDGKVDFMRAEGGDSGDLS